MPHGRMNLQAFPDLASIVRRCLACSLRAPASRLLLDLSDHDRLHAFYCHTCAERGFAEKLAKKRKRESNKSAKNDWRQAGANHLVNAPQLQP